MAGPSRQEEIITEQNDMLRQTSDLREPTILKSLLDVHGCTKLAHGWRGVKRKDVMSVSKNVTG